MPDLEKVIKHIADCIDAVDELTNVQWVLVKLDVLKDALVLLEARATNSTCTKERCPVNASAISDDCNIETCPWRTEALIPIPSMSGLWYECPDCGRHLTKDLDNYCARCGRRVKWDA